MAKRRRLKKGRRIPREHLDDLVKDILETEHAQRVGSIINGVDGVLHAASLGIRAIGAGLAAANGLSPKHATKQVDRLLSNPKLDLEHVFTSWVRFVVGEREEIFVNFDWTDFDDSDQTTLVLGTQTSHGRCTPLVWMTVLKSDLKGKRNTYEDQLLHTFSKCLVRSGHEPRVTVVADRGFSDTKLYEFLTSELGFDYIIRFRGIVHVTDPKKNETRPAQDWTAKGGRMRTIKNALVTTKKAPVAVVVCVRDKAMKDTWCLVSSRADLSGAVIKKAYGKRFSIEETFRDVKNDQLGLGLKQVKIKRCDRRDRLMLLAVLAHTLLTLLGQAGRDTDMEKRYFGVPKGGKSLFRIGKDLWELMPTMPEKWLEPLLIRFNEILLQHDTCSEVLGII